MPSLAQDLILVFELSILCAVLLSYAHDRRSWTLRKAAYVLSVGLFVSVIATTMLALLHEGDPLGRITLVWVYSPRFPDVVLWSAFAVVVVGPRFKAFTLPAWLMLYSIYELMWNALYGLHCPAFLPSLLSEPYGKAFIGGVAATFAITFILLRNHLMVSRSIFPLYVFLAYAGIDFYFGMPIQVDVCTLPAVVNPLNYFWELGFELAFLFAAWGLLYSDET